MIAFITSSPFREDVDRPTFSNANGFVDRIAQCLPEQPRCLYICSSPDRRDLNCRFGADIFMAFANAGIHFSTYQVLDGHNAASAAELVADSDLIVLAGGHVPTQNAFFQQIRLRELLQAHAGVVMGISAGSMNCADVVYAQPEEPGESHPFFPRFLPGLGLTQVNILPHYQKVKNDILTQAQNNTILYTSMVQPDNASFEENYWSNAEAFSNELLDGRINLSNASEATKNIEDAWNGR